MGNIVNFNSETGANYIGDDAQPALTFGNTGGGAALFLSTTLAANATIAPLVLGVGSTASGAVLSLAQTAFVSAVSIVFAASANWAGMGAMRVVKTDGTFGWIPILPDAVVTAAARP